MNLYDFQPSSRERPRSEEQILRILGRHPRIIQLKGKHEDGLLLEYLANGSIERYLQSNAPYTTVAQRLRWGQQAAEGLAYLHKKNVIHCDVSIGNLLLDTHLSIKLCDFQSRFLHPSGKVALSLSAPNFEETLMVAIKQGGKAEAAISGVIKIINSTINHSLFFIAKWPP